MDNNKSNLLSKSNTRLIGILNKLSIIVGNISKHIFTNEIDLIEIEANRLHKISNNILRECEELRCLIEEQESSTDFRINIENNIIELFYSRLLPKRTTKRRTSEKNDLITAFNRMIDNNKEYISEKISIPIKNKSEITIINQFKSEKEMIDHDNIDISTIINLISRNFLLDDNPTRIDVTLKGSINADIISSHTVVTLKSMGRCPKPHKELAP